MRKRILFILAALSVMVFSACSNKSTETSAEPTVKERSETDSEVALDSPSAEAVQEDPEVQLDELKEESVITGTVSELKDFMIVITDDSNAEYALTFENKPNGIDKIKTGDKVEIKYTGVLDEIDTFTGTILSVTKLD